MAINSLCNKQLNPPIYKGMTTPLALHSTFNIYIKVSVKVKSMSEELTSGN